MIFAPHTLQVKVFTPMETDEFGRPIPEPVVKAGRTCVNAVVMITRPRSLLRRTVRCSDRIIT